MPAPTQATRPTAATAGFGAAGAGFGQVFKQVHSEVAGFIRDGGGASGAGGASAEAGTMALSPEGRLWQQRSQGATGADAPGAVMAAATAPSQRQFLEQIAPWAREAGARLGVAPELVAAHAALESGWGQRPLRQAHGGDTHNLFGLKAGAGWRGDAAAALTTEYEGGVAHKTTERFRSYPDQASAFRDYAQLLLENPRYRAALGTGSDAHAFAQGLARGGYATDPHYAGKLARLATQLQRSEHGDRQAAGRGVSQ
jgi:flagellar protein FlgJ